MYDDVLRVWCSINRILHRNTYGSYNKFDFNENVYCIGT